MSYRISRRKFLMTSSAAALAAACAPATSTGGNAATSAAAATAAATTGPALKIGQLLPFTKVYAELGNSMKRSTDLYLKQAGGKLAGRQVQVIYEDEANEIQEHYLEGRRHEAAAAVPDSLVDEVALVGPPDRIQEGLAAWRNAGATLLIAQTRQLETLRVLASAVPS